MCYTKVNTFKMTLLKKEGRECLLGGLVAWTLYDYQYFVIIILTSFYPLVEGRQARVFKRIKKRDRVGMKQWEKERRDEERKESERVLL